MAIKLEWLRSKFRQTSLPIDKSRRQAIAAGYAAISPTVVNEICALIERGAFIDQAALLMGIPKSTAERWLAKGRELIAVAESTPSGQFVEISYEETLYIELVRKSDEARARLVLTSVEEIRAAVDWRAHAYLIDKWDDRYQKHEKHTVETNITHTIEPNFDVLSDEELSEFRRLWLKATARTSLGDGVTGRDETDYDAEFEAMPEQ